MGFPGLPGRYPCQFLYGQDFLFQFFQAASVMIEKLYLLVTICIAFCMEYMRMSSFQGEIWTRITHMRMSYRTFRGRPNELNARIVDKLCYYITYFSLILPCIFFWFEVSGKCPKYCYLLLLRVFLEIVPTLDIKTPSL